MQLMDRDKLRAALENAIKSSEDNNNTITGWHYRAGLKSALVCLMNVPVVEERKHGHWVQVSDWDKNGQAHFDCSVCGAGDVHADDAEVPYCWHCGAVMDEVAEDEVRQNK